MKDTLQAGLSTTRRFTVDRASTIDFMGDDLRVYATPSLVRDLEITCRDFLLEHLDAGEDSVGTRVEIDHLAPTLLDMWVDLTVEITAVKGPMVTFTVSGRDAAGDAIVKGTHMRFASPVAKTAERLRAKAGKLA
ncbi:MAG: hypothetical protein KDE22_14390 [Rhodobacterales bacterium]|nr:hypothetical protein [Rhodobacterales bacterium]